MNPFLNKYYDIIGSSPEILNIIIFLLCFCSPLSTFLILSKIYTDMIPK